MTHEVDEYNVENQRSLHSFTSNFVLLCSMKSPSFQSGETGEWHSDGHYSSAILFTSYPQRGVS